MSEYIITGDRTDTRNGNMYRVYWMGTSGKSAWTTDRDRVHRYANAVRAMNAASRNLLAEPSWMGHWTVEISVWTVEAEAADYAKNCEPGGKFPDRREL